MMTQEEIVQQSSEVVEFLSKKNKQALQDGIEHHALFVTTVAFTLGSLIGFDLKPSGYGPMIGTILDSLTEGIQKAATDKGVNATFIKVVRD
ncbi:hypothetical protein D3C74_140640 [compost metagenome]